MDLDSKPWAKKLATLLIFSELCVWGWIIAFSIFMVKYGRMDPNLAFVAGIIGLIPATFIALSWLMMALPMDLRLINRVRLSSVLCILATALMPLGDHMGVILIFTFVAFFAFFAASALVFRRTLEEAQ